jgi:hypothetical protein
LGGALRQNVSLAAEVSALVDVALQVMDNEPRGQEIVSALFNSSRFSRVFYPVEFLQKRLSRIDGLDIKHSLTSLRMLCEFAASVKCQTDSYSNSFPLL